MPQPHCLYCDTPRPPDQPRCPECGHPWVDLTIADAVRAQPAAAPYAPPVSRLPGDVPAGDPPMITAAGKRRWVFPVAISGAAVLLYAIVFAVLLDRSGADTDPEPPVAGPTTTTAEPTPTTAGEPPPTTAPPLATTTQPPPSTTQPPPTTTTTTEPPIPALGEPIPLEEMTLGAFALGPLEFNDTETNALGRLVATFGQPDELRDIGEADGLCPTEIGRAARFGWLTAYFRGGLEEALVGYRLEPPPEPLPDHPTAELVTISGAAIGDSENTWRAIYSSFINRTIEIDGRTYLLLLRSSDERTLLWAPLSESQPPTIEGIYSPIPCDGGPFG